MNLNSYFNKCAKKLSSLTGKPSAFVFAIIFIIVWLTTGPAFQFNDTWQLIVNTGTSLVTFVMVFLIQNSQNRDTAALQIKLDELIRITQGAHKILLELEELDDEKIEKIRGSYRSLARKARLHFFDKEFDQQTHEVKDCIPETESKPT